MRNFHFPCQVNFECILMFFVDKVWISLSHHCCYFQSTGLGQSREEQKRREMSAIASDEVKYLLQNYFRNNTAHKLWIGRCWESLISDNNNENVNQVARRSGSSKVLLKSNRGEREVESLVKVAKLSKNFDRLLTLTNCSWQKTNIREN